MRVELSKALNILAHDLRGPLGVIQGYLRLLRQRTENEDETRMLTAMQDATGRIAALGRQAVDLAVAVDRPTLEDQPAPLGTIVEQALTQVALPTPPAVELSAVATAPIRFGRNPAVSAAVGALLQAVAKDAAGTPLAIVGTPADAHGIEVKMGPVEIVSQADSDAPRSDRPEHLRLDRGGLGLSLILASHVLDAIGARLTAIGPSGGALAVALRKDGGPQ